jgi:hypothetical protein
MSIVETLFRRKSNSVGYMRIIFSYGFFQQEKSNITEADRTPPSGKKRAIGCTAGVQFPVGTGDFSLLHSVQTGSGAHSAF